MAISKENNQIHIKSGFWDISQNPRIFPKNNLVFFLKMIIFKKKIQNLKFLGISLRIILAYRCEATWTIWLNIVIDMTKTERFIFDWKCVICLNIFLRNGSQVMWESL